jgi:hypothetical protein
VDALLSPTQLLFGQIGAYKEQHGDETEDDQESQNRLGGIVGVHQQNYCGWDDGAPCIAIAQD